MTYEENIKDQIESYIRDASPASALEHAMTYGYLKGLLDKDITQTAYSEIVELNARTLRKYIKDNQKDYDAELLQGQTDADERVDPANINTRLLSEEQIDKFVETLYLQAIKGNARDRQLLIDFTGMTAEDVLSLQKSKETSLRWWIKANLSHIKDAVDNKALGIQINESEYLYRGDKASADNVQNFINADLTDEAFKLELMHWGMSFMQIYNNQAHPDASMLDTALRISRLQQGTAQPLNKAMIKRYAEGSNLTRQERAVSDDELRASLLDVFDKDEVDQMMLQMQGAKKITRSPEIDAVRVKQRASEHEDQLEVMLTTEDYMRKMFSNKIKENTKEND